MALQSIYPFRYRAFTAELNDSVSEIINIFENREPKFWWNTLRRYSFRGSDFQQGEKVRIEFHARLSTCTDGELFDVANEILAWGEMDPLNDTMKRDLRRSLDCLNLLARGETVEITDLCVERVASITKMYEMWDVGNWVIYDSYCARGLQWLISGLWNSLAYRKHERLLKLPWPPGRIGFPVSGFPRMADTAPNQKRLGFIYGSWLCKAIAERLTALQNNAFDWKPYHIEMLAFQLGHEVDK